MLAWEIVSPSRKTNIFTAALGQAPDESSESTLVINRPDMVAVEAFCSRLESLHPANTANEIRNVRK